ncbi:MAG: cysteine desulfurase [bacterium]|nr:cysteine desulfurase [bacterium]
MNMNPVYLDHNATTPLDPRVVEAMEPYLREHFGNPSSPHVYGRRAQAAVEDARRQVAAALEVDPAGVVFTSGGTEANNQAIVGLAGEGGHLVTTAVEHPAVLEVCRHLERRGVTTTLVPVDARGRIDPARVADAITPDTRLVSVMLANNEVGTLQPVAEVAALARSRGIPCHTDAAQAVGKIPVSCATLGVDLLSVAGHKLYAPKGVGALLIRPGLDLPCLMHGASHEQGRRPGTENVAGIVGLGVACRLAAAETAAETCRLGALRDRLAARLVAAVPHAVIHGHPDLRLLNTLSISFPGRAAPDLLDALPGVAVSAGAACHGDGQVGSHVLAAMGVDAAVARGTLRISLGRFNTDEEIERAGEEIAAVVGGN